MLGALYDSSRQNALAALEPPPMSVFETFLSGAGAFSSSPFKPPPPLLGNALAQFAPSPSFLGSALAPYEPPTPPHVSGWSYVVARFSRMLDNLHVTTWQATDGTGLQGRVRACLNRAYWNISSATANSMMIGSWGKNTHNRPPSDIDVLHLLPAAVWRKYEGRHGNKQSQLLQEVKNLLSSEFAQTSMPGDGQVVIIRFSAITVEVSPGFRCTDGGIIVCDTNDAGRYVTSTSEAEIADLSAIDTACNGNARALARMMKQWRRERNVPLKSFHLERLAVEFLRSWQYSTKSLFYYDWMVRDFLAFLNGRANTWLVMPGTGEFIWLGDEWLSRSQNAYENAVWACEHERANNDALAGEAWKKIFGTLIPSKIS